MPTNHENPDQHASPRTQTPDVLLNNPEAMQKPKELLKLEIGAGSSAGFNELKLASSGATIVTVNAPDSIDRGDTTWGISDKSPSESTYSPDNDRVKEEISESDATEFTYAFLPIVGDGRNMDYFNDGTFGEVMMHNVVSDPSISAENVAKLITEALRVGDELELWDNITAYATTGRLDYANLEQAGIIRTTKRVLDKYGDTAVEVLTKAENFGKTELVIPDGIPEHFSGYNSWRQQLDAEADRLIKEQEKAEKKQARREKLASGVLGKLMRNR